MKKPLLTRTAAPLAEPVSVERARQHLRVDHANDDALIADHIATARQAVEDQTGRALLAQAWRLEQDEPPCDGALQLPHAPLTAVTGVTYLDHAGARVTLAPSLYVVQAPSGDAPPRGWLRRAYNATWPSMACGPGAFQVSYTCGYGTGPEAVPALLKAAILLIVGELYENREASGPNQWVQVSPALDRLLSPYRLWWPE